MDSGARIGSTQRAVSGEARAARIAPASLVRASAVAACGIAVRGLWTGNSDAAPTHLLTLSNAAALWLLAGRRSITANSAARGDVVPGLVDGGGAGGDLSTGSAGAAAPSNFAPPRRLSREHELALSGNVTSTQAMPMDAAAVQELLLRPAAEAGAHLAERSSATRDRPTAQGTAEGSHLDDPDLLFAAQPKSGTGAKRPLLDKRVLATGLAEAAKTTAVRALEGPVIARWTGPLTLLAAGLTAAGAAAWMAQRRHGGSLRVDAGTGGSGAGGSFSIRIVRALREVADGEHDPLLLAVCGAASLAAALGLAA
jgi:hypothetical protein